MLVSLIPLGQVSWISTYSVCYWINTGEEQYSNIIHIFSLENYMFLDIFFQKVFCSVCQSKLFIWIQYWNSLVHRIIFFKSLHFPFFCFSSVLFDVALSILSFNSCAEKEPESSSEKTESIRSLSTLRVPSRTNWTRAQNRCKAELQVKADFSVILCWHLASSLQVLVVSIYGFELRNLLCFAGYGSLLTWKLFWTTRSSSSTHLPRSTSTC